MQVIFREDLPKEMEVWERKFLESSRGWKRKTKSGLSTASKMWSHQKSARLLLRTHTSVHLWSHGYFQQGKKVFFSKSDTFNQKKKGIFLTKCILSLKQGELLFLCLGFPPPHLLIAFSAFFALTSSFPEGQSEKTKIEKNSQMKTFPRGACKR